jgi:hypothetical protein
VQVARALQTPGHLAARVTSGKPHGKYLFKNASVAGAQEAPTAQGQTVGRPSFSGDDPNRLPERLRQRRRDVAIVNSVREDINEESGFAIENVLIC